MEEAETHGEQGEKQRSTSIVDVLDRRLDRATVAVPEHDDQRSFGSQAWSRALKQPPARSGSPGKWPQAL